MIYDVIITKDCVVIICCHCVVQQLCLWQRYIMMYGFSGTLLKSYNSSQTGPPSVSFTGPLQRHIYFKLKMCVLIHDVFVFI